jgi:hypothetical protein
MRTILSGRVTPELIAMADLFGITPTSFVTNGRSAAPAGLDLPVAVFPVDPKLGILGPEARDYTLCQNADALIAADGDQHLIDVALQYLLPVYGA